MKRFIFLVVIASLPAMAQFKSNLPSRSDVSESYRLEQENSLFLGFFDPSKFSMQHSYSLSYMSFGNQNLSLGEYTNRMSYRFSDNLNLQADVSFTHSPFNSFGDKFSKDITGLRLSRVELNYKPWDNTYIQIQYRQPPLGFYSNRYGYGYGASMWDNYSFDEGIR